MPDTPSRHRSTATVLAWVYAALIVYASLYPFSGWLWPRLEAWPDLLLPSVPLGDAFDTWSNVVGYIPFGLLIMIGRLRSGASVARALCVALLVPSALSYAMELTQAAVPTRRPSLKDWELNTAGAATGMLLALAMHRFGLADRWHALRQRWFQRDSGVALALLALWPVGLLFPAPAPLGLGQVGGGRARDVLESWFEALPWVEGARDAAHAAPPVVEAAAAAAGAPAGLSPLAEILIIAMGLLAPCVIAFSVVAPGWRRLALAFGALVLATVGMTMSTGLNFGPSHALAWVTPWTGPAVGLAALGVLLLAPLSPAKVLGIGLIVLTGLVVAVAQAPADPYFAQNLQAWEQGRFVRFHGLAQWVGWLWPYAAMAWLLSRLSVRS
jgi:VanZ family protein